MKPIRKVLTLLTLNTPQVVATRYSSSFLISPLYILAIPKVPNLLQRFFIAVGVARLASVSLDAQASTHPLRRLQRTHKRPVHTPTQKTPTNAQASTSTRQRTHMRPHPRGFAAARRIAHTHLGLRNYSRPNLSRIYVLTESASGPPSERQTLRHRCNR